MSALSQTAKTARIRELNDAFRRTFAGGKVTMTAGVYALPDMVKAAALQKAATFDAFTEDNDPHGEHDFGSFELCRDTTFQEMDAASPYGFGIPLIIIPPALIPPAVCAAIGASHLSCAKA